MEDEFSKHGPEGEKELGREVLQGGYCDDQEEDTDFHVPRAGSVDKVGSDMEDLDDLDEHAPEGERELSRDASQCEDGDHEEEATILRVPRAGSVQEVGSDVGGSDNEHGPEGETVSSRDALRCEHGDEENDAAILSVPRANSVDVVGSDVENSEYELEGEREMSKNALQCEKGDSEEEDAMFLSVHRANSVDAIGSDMEDSGYEPKGEWEMGDGEHRGEAAAGWYEKGREEGNNEVLDGSMEGDRANLVPIINRAGSVDTRVTDTDDSRLEEDQVEDVLVRNEDGSSDGEDTAPGEREKEFLGSGMENEGERPGGLAATRPGSDTNRGYSVDMMSRENLKGVAESGTKNETIVATRSDSVDMGDFDSDLVHSLLNITTPDSVDMAGPICEGSGHQEHRVDLALTVIRSDSVDMVGSDGGDPGDEDKMDSVEEHLYDNQHGSAEEAMTSSVESVGLMDEEMRDEDHPAQMVDRAGSADVGSDCDDDGEEESVGLDDEGYGVEERWKGLIDEEMGEGEDHPALVVERTASVDIGSDRDDDKVEGSVQDLGCDGRSPYLTVAQAASVKSVGSDDEGRDIEGNWKGSKDYEMDGEEDQAALVVDRAGSVEVGSDRDDDEEEGSVEHALGGDEGSPELAVSRTGSVESEGSDGENHGIEANWKDYEMEGEEDHAALIVDRTGSVEVGSDRGDDEQGLVEDALRGDGGSPELVVARTGSVESVGSDGENHGIEANLKVDEMEGEEGHAALIVDRAGSVDVGSDCDDDDEEEEGSMTRRRRARWKTCGGTSVGSDDESCGIEESWKDGEMEGEEDHAVLIVDRAGSVDVGSDCDDDDEEEGSMEDAWGGEGGCQELIVPRTGSVESVGSDGEDCGIEENWKDLLDYEMGGKEDHAALIVDRTGSVDVGSDRDDGEDEGSVEDVLWGNGGCPDLAVVRTTSVELVGSDYEGHVVDQGWKGLADDEMGSEEYLALVVNRTSSAPVCSDHDDHDPGVNQNQDMSMEDPKGSRALTRPFRDRRTKTGFRRSQACPKNRPMNRKLSPLQSSQPALGSLVGSHGQEQASSDSSRTIGPTDDELEDDEDAHLYVPPSPPPGIGSDHEHEASDHDEADPTPPPGIQRLSSQSPVESSGSDTWSCSNSVVNEFYQEHRSNSKPVVGKNLAKFTRVLFTAAVPSARNALPSRNRQPAGSDDDTETEDRDNKSRASPSKAAPKNIRKERDPVRKAISPLAQSLVSSLMKRRADARGESPIQTVTTSRVIAFFTQKREDLGPSEDYFQLCFSTEGLDAPTQKLCNAWNKQAAAVFVQIFVQKHPSYKGEEAKIRSCYESHVKYLKRQFTAQDLQEDDEADETRNWRSSKVQLQRSRCERRLHTMESYSSVPALVHLAKKMKSFLDWRCCSGGETDSDGEQAITVLPWRARPIREFMRTVDLLNLLLRFPNNSNPTQGRFPKYRYDPLARDPPQEPAEDQVHSNYVKGLPLNFYDSTWLASLTPLERKSLEATPPIDLNLPAAVLELAETAVTVRGRSTLPLPRDFDI